MLRGLVVAGVVWAGGWILLAAASADPAVVPLSELDARFRPVDTPISMEYDVGYRFLRIELKRIGKIVATTTIGTWRHRLTGVEVPALFLDVRADSPDSGKKGERSRVSIHDRMVAVLTVPELEVLLFAKYSDEYLHPLIGRARETLSSAMYNTEAGRLEYEGRDLKSGVVSTNLVNAEALLELSRRIRPVMNFLIRQCAAKFKASVPEEPERIVVNMDGRVVALRLVTELERSPVCLGRRKFDALHVSTATERGSKVKPRDFHAWCLPFETLAEQQGDSALLTAARAAPIRSVVPLVLDYELGLGHVRATMTAIHPVRP
ncbi:MAG: hypothetical protein NTV49_16665 [Kiritimatiellaeota bacterium]|nr:hypothetical protein [Kiritimatiellota bacterium]